MSTLPSSEYTKELSKLLESGKYRLAVLRLPEAVSPSDIEGFQIDPLLNRITSATFKATSTNNTTNNAAESESLHLEIVPSINYSLLVPQSSGSLRPVNKLVEGWNVVKSLKGSGENGATYDMAVEDTSGIPQLPVIPQPSVILQKTQPQQELEPVKKKKRKVDQ